MDEQILGFLRERWLRLALMAAVGAGSAIAYVVRRRRAARIASHRPASPPCDLEAEPGSPSAEVLRLLGDVRPGLRVGRFDVVQVYEPDRGAVPLLLTSDGGAQIKLIILRRDPAGPPPPAEAGQLSVYVTGVPRGSRSSRVQVDAAQALASALAAAGAEPPEWMASMQTRPPHVRGP